MKKYLSFVVLATVLNACGGGSNTPTPNMPAVTDDGVKYSRDFSGTLMFNDVTNGAQVSSTEYNSNELNDVLGCSEADGGRSFVFFLKTGAEALKIEVGNAFFRESKSSYDELVDVTLTGSAAGLSFDRAQKSYQLQTCGAEVDRRGNSLSGTFHCHNVVGLNSNDQTEMALTFSCQIVAR